MNTMRIAKVLSIAAALLFALQLNAQYVSGVNTPDSSAIYNTDTSDVSVLLASTISAEDMREHLTILASDEFGGRETGHPGNDMAAEYISGHLNSLGVPKIMDGDYYQDVAFTYTTWEANTVTINGNDYKGAKDFIAFPDKTGNASFQAKEVLYLGYGIDDPEYSDYKKVKVRDKVILINKGEPMKKDSSYWLTGTSEPSSWTGDIDRKLKAAKKHGVRMVLIIEDGLREMVGKNRRKLLGPTVTLTNGLKDNTELANHLYISTTMAKDIIGDKDKKVIKSRKYITKKGKNCDAKLKPTFTVNQLRKSTILLGRNILGFFEGTDLKDEIVVVSAHYDHIGKKGDVIYNGADDNGSGTTTVLEIAEALAISKNMGQSPRRSVLCLLVTGEEKGLLGSYYYSENPVFDVDKTVADVNIDMVGRVDKKYEDNPNYIYVIGSDRLSTDLHKINENANNTYAGLTLDYKYNDEKDPNRYYFRSDHYNFARLGIPSIFFFNGVHEDYHQPGDTVDKINFDKMQNVGRLIFHTIWDLANRNDRIVVDGKVKAGR